MMLTNLAAIARRTGYPVVEVPGWKTRGRPGGMLGVRTITCHHTANGGAKGDYPSLRVVRDGRKGLPGPLAQYGLGRSGTIYVIAAGKCNHAGVSRETSMTNSYAVGIEAEAVGVPGTKGDWPPDQMDAYARLCRALADEFELKTGRVLGHSETCSPKGRKTDPSFSMAGFRTDVSTVDLSKPLRSQEEKMDQEAAKLNADAVWARKETITKAAAAALGDPALEGTQSGMDTLLQFPPSIARLRREVDENDTARTEQIASVKKQLDRVEAEQTEQRGILERILENTTAPAPPPAGQ